MRFRFADRFEAARATVHATEPTSLPRARAMVVRVTGERVVGGKYRLLRKLGEGGAAAAWVAENTVVGRIVAVKILHSELASDPETRRRFLAEARAAARIAHANVVDVFDLGTDDDGTPFIVMELCDGETLSEIIDERGRMGVPYATDLMMQVLAALHAAHDLGIVHRDLKPDNIMIVHPRPDRPMVKVLDFGIAQVVQEGGPTPADEQDHVFGTPEYMAPEQARGEPVDARADLYSAGVILYELLTGTVPFTGASPAEVIAGMLSRPPPSVGRLVADIPEALDHLLKSALSKRRDNRPSSALEFMRSLAPFTTSGRIPSVVPLDESAPPLPLVSQRPSPDAGARPTTLTASRLELVLDSSVPPPERLLDRKK